MVKYYCDKCGKEIKTPKEEWYKVNVNNFVNQMKFDNIYMGLCKECYQELKTFLLINSICGNHDFNELYFERDDDDD